MAPNSWNFISIIFIKYLKIYCYLCEFNYVFQTVQSDTLQMKKDHNNIMYT